MFRNSALGRLRRRPKITKKQIADVKKTAALMNTVGRLAVRQLSKPKDTAEDA